jgi:hypothetical protein
MLVLLTSASSPTVACSEAQSCTQSHAPTAAAAAHAGVARHRCAPPASAHLPRAQVEPAVGDGYVKGAAKHAALDVSRHVIIALVGVHPGGLGALRSRGTAAVAQQGHSSGGAAGAQQRWRSRGTAAVAQQGHSSGWHSRGTAAGGTAASGSAGAQQPLGHQCGAECHLCRA